MAADRPAAARQWRRWCWWLLAGAATLAYIAHYGLTTFLQQFLNGLQIGSIYALIALGYTMVYGIVKLINFAHGDLFMFGAYIACFTGAAALGGEPFSILAFVLALVTAMAATALLGWGIERVAYRPLREQPRLSALITALGVSLLLENFFALPPEQVPWPLQHLVFGPQFIHFPDLLPVTVWQIGGVSVSSLNIVNLAVAFFLMLALEWFVQRTRTGMAMRAVALNRDAAALMGVNVNRIIALTFVIGSALGAAGGMLFALRYGTLQSPYLGVWPGLKAFIAAVLGGIGSVPGAMLGGVLMGLTETYATSINSNLGSGIAFILLIVVLLVRPAGLLGVTRREKV